MNKAYSKDLHKNFLDLSSEHIKTKQKGNDMLKLLGDSVKKDVEVMAR